MGTEWGRGNLRRMPVAAATTAAVKSRLGRQASRERDTLRAPKQPHAREREGVIIWMRKTFQTSITTDQPTCLVTSDCGGPLLDQAVTRPLARSLRMPLKILGRAAAPPRAASGASGVRNGGLQETSPRPPRHEWRRGGGFGIA